MRSFPTGFGKETVYPRLVLLLRCTDVRIAGLKFLHSRSWTINPYACHRLTIDGVYIYSDPKEAVWADGIDPDGCTDVHISNSTIDTGDDALVFYSARPRSRGPALPVGERDRDQLPVVVGIERAEILRWQFEGDPARGDR